MNKNAGPIKQLVKTGLLELMREPRTFFFVLIFPLIFLAMFGGMSLVIPTSEQLGLSFIEYMFPGILILALVSTGAFGTSTPLIDMRQKGTIRLLQITPLKKEVFIVSQIIVRFMIAVVQIILFLVIGFFMNLVNLTMMAPIFSASLLGMAMILTLGFIIGSIFNSLEIASGLLGGLIAPILMLSGVLFPLQILPSAFETVAKFIPFTYLGDLMKSIMISSLEPMHSVYVNVIVLIGCTVIFFVVAKYTFKWETE